MPNALARYEPADAFHRASPLSSLSHEPVNVPEPARKAAFQVHARSLASLRLARKAAAERRQRLKEREIVRAMTAFAISETEILDEDLADRYRLLAQESIARYQGRYVVRGTPDVIEGEWPPQRRLTIVEFPNLSTLREWYSSAEYAQAREPAGTAMTRRPLFIGGADSDDPGAPAGRG